MITEIIYLTLGTILGSGICYLKLNKRNNQNNQNEELNSSKEHIENLNNKIKELKENFNVLDKKRKEVIIKFKNCNDELNELKEKFNSNNIKENIEFQEALIKIGKLETKEHTLLNSLNIQKEENNILKLKLETILRDRNRTTLDSEEEILEKSMKNILLVESSNLIIDNIKQLLNNPNYKITISKDVASALSVLDINKHFDLILTDYDIIFIKELNQNITLQDIPLIIMTDHDNILLETINTKNIVGIIQKPFDDLYFINKINNTLS